MNRSIVALWASVVVAVGSGAAYMGHLNGRIDALDPNAIRTARDQAIKDIRSEVGEVANEWRAPALVYSMTVQDGANYNEPLGLGADEGICYLSSVRGNFRGDGERVWVAQEDGQWRLRGTSRSQGVHVEAHCWRFPWVAESAGSN